MREVSECLKWLSLYCLLLSICIPLNAEVIPGVFPFANLSSIYLLALSSCLVARYCQGVVGGPMQKGMMIGLAAMVLLLALLRCVKYSVFGGEFLFGRYTWYLYYVPFLLIPLLFFLVSVSVFAADERRAIGRWWWVVAITVALILLVLTNDAHQQVFGFQPGFERWDRAYSREWGYVALVVWQCALYAAAVCVLLAKSSVARAGRQAWLILLPFAMGAAGMLLLATGSMPKLNGFPILGAPELYCFMAAGVLECCMQVGLIPTNKGYRELMRRTSLPALIVDGCGNAVYKSDAVGDLPPDCSSLPDGTRVGDHAILRKMRIRGGFGLWLMDVERSDRLNDELAEVGDRLGEEAQLVRLQNELAEMRAKVEQRSMLYDFIAKRTQAQSTEISRIARRALASRDDKERDECRKHILLLSSFIKRYANLLLLSSGDAEGADGASCGADAADDAHPAAPPSPLLGAGELAVSIREVLRYLNLYGIPGECVSTAEGGVCARAALATFEAFGLLLESNLDSLKGAYANISAEDGQPALKLVLEGVHLRHAAQLAEKLASAGVRAAFEQEDDAVYCHFALHAGGESA